MKNSRKFLYSCLSLIILLSIWVNMNSGSNKFNHDVTMFYIHLAEKCTKAKMYGLSNFYYRVAIKVSNRPTVWLNYNIAKNIINDQWNKPLTSYKKAKLDEAIKLLDIEIVKHPNNADINAHYAYAYDLLEEYEKAIEYYLKVIDKIKVWEYGFKRLATLYDNVIDDDEKALEYADKALEVVKDEETRYSLIFTKARALSSLKRTKEAIEYYKLYLEKYPDAVWALVNISWCEVKIKDYENAFKHVEHGLELNRYSSYLLKSKINILIHKNKLDEARDIINGMLTRNPESGWIGYYSLGIIERKLNNIEESDNYFNKAKENAQEYYNKYCDKPYDLSDMDGKCANRYHFLKDFDKDLKETLADI